MRARRAAPYLAAHSLAEKRLMQRVAVGLFDRINSLTANGVLVVDLMCDPRLLASSSYASDGFHPSDAGYAIIAEKAFPAVRDGTSSIPSTSCGPRTVF